MFWFFLENIVPEICWLNLFVKLSFWKLEHWREAATHKLIYRSQFSAFCVRKPEESKNSVQVSY